MDKEDVCIYIWGGERVKYYSAIKKSEIMPLQLHVWTQRL